MPAKQRGRPRGTFGRHRAEGLRRSDGGATVAEIARRLRISKQAVSRHRRDSGRDSAARDGQTWRAERERFAELWNAAPDLGAAAAALALKRMPDRRGPQRPRAAPVTARVLELHNRGLSRAAILRRTGANPGYVSQLLGGSYRPRALMTAKCQPPPA
jgi:hypothetical protein